MYLSVWRKFGCKGSGSMMVSIDDIRPRSIIIIQFSVDYNIKLRWIILLQQHACSMINGNIRVFVRININYIPIWLYII